MKTVLITGCSSGYGLETARHFHAQGWNVVATMRTPREGILPRSERLRVLPLDVTRPESIAAALEASGPIDVLVNNAGIGLVGAFEATPMAHAREVFETNTFGVMAMTQAVLPAIPRAEVRRGGQRDVQRGAGADAAGGGLHRQQDGNRGVHGIARPRASRRSTCASSWSSRATRRPRAFRRTPSCASKSLIPEAYAPFAQPIFAAFAQPAMVTTESDVAEAVWRRRERYIGAAPFPGGRRRRGAGPGRVN